jgi:hypothetical protein
VWQWSGTAWVQISGGGGAGSGAASGITFAPGGNISATDVQAAILELDTEKAPLASPTFTGDPKAPTPTAGDNDTSIATTAFVATAVTAAGSAAQVVRYDIAQTLTAAQQAQARQNISAPLRGWIAGLTLSTAGSSATFGVAAGEAADSTTASLMQLASAVTKTTSAWAVGTGNGALDTGAIAVNTWYHVHLIKRVDTQIVDVLVSLSATAPTLPANYTLFRRIGSMKTNASSQWIGFIQTGDQFRWTAPLQDVAATNPGTAAVTRILSVPLGAVVEVDIAVLLVTPATNYGLITSLAEPDNTPSGLVLNFGMSFAGGGQLGVSLRGVFTNTSAQVRSRLSASSASDTLFVYTFGWIDRRGRDA